MAATPGSTEAHYADWSSDVCSSDLADGPDLLQEVKERAEWFRCLLIGQAKQDVPLRRSADFGDGGLSGYIGDPSSDRDAKGSRFDTCLQARFENFEGVFGQG